MLQPAWDSWERGHDLPDVLGGRVVGGLIALEVQNAGPAWVRDVRLRVAGSAPSVGEGAAAVDLAPFQVARLDARLDAPGGPCKPHAEVVLEVLASGIPVAQKTLQLRCREAHDRLTFLYRDFET